MFAENYWQIIVLIDCKAHSTIQYQISPNETKEYNTWETHCLGKMKCSTLFLFYVGDRVKS